MRSVSIPLPAAALNHKPYKSYKSHKKHITFWRYEMMNRKQALRRAIGVSLAFGLVFAPYVAPADIVPSVISASVAEAASVGAEDVVLVGTIQTKFGAGTDWAPADPKTIMTKKGDTYEYTGKLPKGNYEYKIAIGGSWGENYGADGARDGANMKLSLAKDAEVTFIYDSITHETTVKVAGDAVANPKEGAAAQEAKASAGALQPTDVVLVGSLQDELGAGKEWDPSDAKTLMKPDGKGHRVYVQAVDAPFSFNALHYSVSDIYKAGHDDKLKMADATYLSLDCAVMGLGNSSCGPGVLKKYAINKHVAHQLHFKIWMDEK